SKVIENVFATPAPDGVTNPLASQSSWPNSGTLMLRILKALMFAKPNACTGKLPRVVTRAAGFRSSHAAAILGTPFRNSVSVEVLPTSPRPKLMLPLELQKNPSHTPLPAPQAAPTLKTSPSGFPNRNSKPPLNGPATTGFPAPSESSPRLGNAWSSPPATW